MSDKFEEFWSSIKTLAGDLENPSQECSLIFDILESSPNIDFEQFYDANGNAKSFEELCKMKKIGFSYEPGLSTWENIHLLYEASKYEGKGEFFSYHIVGAALAFLFPEVPISNESASTADKQTNRAGDFIVGDTVFHVTIAPMPPVFEKSKQNLKDGMKVYLIVPDEKLVGTRQLALQYAEGQIAVESIESFVSQNIEEISLFASDNLKHSLFKLIRVYNERVDAVEVDKSIMIELPSNLKKGDG